MSASILRPIVLIGAARSGTKVLRDSLAASLGVPTVPYDVGYVWRYGNESRPDDRLTPEDVKPKTRRMVRRFLGGYADPDGWVVEKTVGNTLRVRFVAELLPEAFFVHLVRDGVEVAHSARREWEAPADLRYLLAKTRHFPLRLTPSYGRKFLVGATVGRWRTTRAGEGHAPTWGPRYPGIDLDLEERGLLTVTARQWRASVEAATSDRAEVPQQVVTLRYESLVADPAGTLARVTRAIGAPLDDSRLKEASAMIVSRPGSGARDTLARAERDLLKGEIGYLLEDLGYDAP